MLKFYQKRTLLNWCQSPLVIGGMLILCIFLARSVYERFTIEREMAARREEVEAEVIELQERRDSLEERVDYLSNERGIEAEMRRNFDVARPGEEVIIILDDTPAEVVEPVLAPASGDDRPWYQFW